MKFIKEYKKWLVISLFPMFLIMCMTIEKITHPDDPKVNSTIEIEVDLKLEPENDDNTKLVFAVLAPKSWNISDNAELLLTTNGYTKGDVTNESMTLIPKSELEPTTMLNWSSALQSEVGLMGNNGPVEWVVFESQTQFFIDDDVDKLITANVNIKLNTGNENIKLFMGYFFCGKNKGMHADFYKENAKSKVLTLTGGSNAMIDYTVASLFSTIPQNYGWGDIFSVNFETKVGDFETELYDAQKVYLYGKVFYSNNSDSTIIDVISEKTLMEKISETSWQKYIYPKDFFNLPDNAIIDRAYFHFTNEDKSIVVRNTSGEDYLLLENCN